MFETYTVRSGDCLWDISKARYGYAPFWPSLYSFNNWAATRHIQHARFIVDPNRISPGQKILLPDLDMTLLRRVIETPKLVDAVRRADACASGKPGSRTRYSFDPLVKSASQVARAMRDNPAAYLGFKPFLAFEYDLDDLATSPIVTPIFTAEIKWSGKIVMQPLHDDALVTLSNHGAVIAHEFKADTAFGDLGSEASVTWKPGDKQPGFACNLTRAGHGPIPKVAIEADKDGTKFVLSWKPFTGNFQGYAFVAVAKCEITVKPKPGGGAGDPTKPATTGTFGPMPSNRSPIPTPTVRLRTFGNIPARGNPIIAANSHHFGLPRITPSGMAPAVGAGVIGGLFYLIMANPELLAFALL